MKIHFSLSCLSQNLSISVSSNLVLRPILLLSINPTFFSGFYNPDETDDDRDELDRFQHSPSSVIRR
jgi:hypothetical protein